jgi:hypothetical protein
MNLGTALGLSALAKINEDDRGAAAGDEKPRRPAAGEPGSL